ncbi:MAG: ATP synthase subunit I [Nitrosomonadales bacterium]|nr:ATP synthase subunit I [Nitrosomonadales bacterium]
MLGTITTYFFVTPQAARSVAYGSCIALIGTLFLAWRLKQGESKESSNAEWHLRQAYRTAIERFVWVAVMLAIGFGILKLAPVWVLAGFVTGQAAWLLVPVWTRWKTGLNKIENTK